MDIPALAFCGIDTFALKPKSSAYPKVIQTIGDQLRATRIERELLQNEVANVIGVSEATITNWENNLSEPKIMHLPEIINFLGFSPYRFNTKTLGGKIKQYRNRYGLSHKKMGTLLKVNASTIGSWENNEHAPQGELRKNLNKLLQLE